MIKRLRRLRTLVLELPKQLRLAYCLARDPRTPALPKAALTAALAVILNPAVDIPMWIPVVGQMDTIALTVLVLRTFNSQAPDELREEIQAEIGAGNSAFDRDLASAGVLARRLARVASSVQPRRVGPGPLRLRNPSQPAAWYRSSEPEADRAGSESAQRTEPASGAGDEEQLP